eukprot:CAMPEP_0201880308 /NCGR_PEP_ID=MMETSP0902-20130614/10930_1 /ASSEMBLY_ACC=CAM_ASM_000551 /TAXON_ID=420261 /ORGANISM="Thalassiosira antarctica, Strain CCMP982" /LENGTH=86 /DNA_ID=CAMNT_0048408295 /DNA_START=293 /DNA_END=550 /DNA_ORIENTATION=-
MIVTQRGVLEVPRMTDSFEEIVWPDLMEGARYDHIMDTACLESDESKISATRAMYPPENMTGILRAENVTSTTATWAQMVGINSNG